MKRDAGGRRDYREEGVEWVKFIKRFKDTGMLLRDTKHYSNLQYQGDDTMEEWIKLLIRHRESVLEEQKRWDGYLNNLDKKIEIYQKGIEKMEERNAESS